MIAVITVTTVTVVIIVVDIQDISITGIIKSTGNNIGSIAGANFGKIHNCKNYTINLLPLYYHKHTMPF